MWYDNEIKEYADIFRKINERYCDRHNYDFFIVIKNILIKNLHIINYIL